MEYEAYDCDGKLIGKGNTILELSLATGIDRSIISKGLRNNDIRFVKIENGIRHYRYVYAYYDKEKDRAVIDSNIMNLARKVHHDPKWLQRSPDMKKCQTMADANEFIARRKEIYTPKPKQETAKPARSGDTRIIEPEPVGAEFMDQWIPIHPGR